MLILCRCLSVLWLSGPVLADLPEQRIDLQPAYRLANENTQNLTQAQTRAARLDRQKLAELNRQKLARQFGLTNVLFR